MMNWEKAFIADEKLLNYLLDEENSKGKSTFFNLFGFDKNNFEELKSELLNLACSGEVIAAESNIFGVKFTVIGKISSPVNRFPFICSIWIIKKEEDFPRLITAYPY